MNLKANYPKQDLMDTDWHAARLPEQPLFSSTRSQPLAVLNELHPSESLRGYSFL
jgi:hypothetical protein